MKIIKTLKYTAAPIKGGCTDRILRADLTSNEITIMELEPGFKHKYIGGRGYALKLIWDETSSATRYDSDDNILVLSGGPLCNEPQFPGSGKFVAGTISPLTGTFIDSNVGGHFSSLLKSCGFDAVAVKGISKGKVILIIDEDKGEISLAQAPEYGAEIDRGGYSYGEALLKDYTDNNLNKNIAAVTTGIGAQNTRFGIINSHFFDTARNRLRVKQAGRGGTGTVMRFKGLMSIIVHTSRSREKKNNPENHDGVRHSGSELRNVIRSEDGKQLNLGLWGTTALVEYMNKFHLLPVNNFQAGQHPDAKNVFADVFLKKFIKEKRADGCYFGCNLACAKGAEDVTITRGPHAGEKKGIDGPEYETIGAVTCLGIYDPHFIMEFNWYCDEYGLDTISMGVSSAFLMECYQRGYLTIEDSGYALEWGNVASVDRLLHETAMGTGIGKLCGMGIHRAKKIIAEKYSRRTGASEEETIKELNKFGMEVKGLEFSMYNPRESLAQQGGYGFALKGPQHDEAWLIFLDQVHNEIETFEKKADALKFFPLIRTWFNAVGLCKLPWIDVRNPKAAGTANPAKNMPTLDLYVEYVNSTTGTNKSLDDVLLDSERLYILQKMINLRQGKGTREHDQIPLRAMSPVYLEEYEARSDYYDQWLTKQDGSNTLPETTPEKHSLLINLREKAYQKLCDTVYQSKGFNMNAVPLRETLEKFDLYDDKASELLKRYSL